ncbi:MAG: SRPBCC family protein [Bdellovibrionales bacterium]|nr:SRPBCC family protein [Oligoflexia bacterium]
MAQAEMDKTYDVSADKYFKAVTEYENYPDFVDGVKKVKAARSGNKVKGDYELSMMGKDMSYSLNINEDPAKKTIDWTLAKSDFFKVNSGAWKIESTGANSCKVNYSLEIELSMSVPNFILKGAVKTSLPTMMNSFYERAKKS